MVRKKVEKMAGHEEHDKCSHLTISFNYTVFSKSAQVLSVSFCQCRVTLRCFKMTLFLSRLIRSDVNNEKYSQDVFAPFGCISKTAVEKLAKIQFTKSYMSVTVINLYKLFLTFESMDKILKCDHS